MKGILKIHDGQGHEHYIVVAKIREVFTAMGNLVIVWDNGDKKTIDTTDAKKMLGEVVAATDAFYTK